MFSLLALRKQHQNAESGFTLIELLVVILIIGILSAIAVPIFLNQRKSAVEASLKSDMRSISQNMENCLLKNKNTYPDLWVSWAGKTIIPTCFSDLKLSKGTETHSYDMAFHPPAGWTVPAGQVYCVEIVNTNIPGVVKFFRSDKGVFNDSPCQAQ
jgi:prepilin-type N-terminal cleavage/methylation domain-containing protein